MNDQPTLDLQNSESDDSLNLATYAQRAYLEYALSVVKGRALPDVCDGQNLCSGAFCIPCLAWAWASRAPRVPSRLKVRAWWAMSWAASIRMAIKQLSLSAAERDGLERAFAQLITAALEQPQVLVHRDYHSRNLMVCTPGYPGVLDFQDAVRGPVTYDLASLYKDCYLRWPREQVLAWVESYRVAALAAGLLPAAEDAAAFRRHFDLMGAQRHLKVLGIFARLWWRDGKPGYLHDLPRVLDYVLEVLPWYPELQPLQTLLADRVVPAFAAAQARALGAVSA